MADSISWNFSRQRFQGSCTPAACNIPNSNNLGGLDCRCNNAFMGNITWNGVQPRGNCTPAPCEVQHSNGNPGLNCACLDGFSGDISWTNSTPSGSCKPAPCNVEHSNAKSGLECACSNAYVGRISWDRAVASGPCTPAPCNISNTVYDGLECRCKDGYEGKIAWNGSNAQGTCEPAKCTVPNSDTVPGPKCRCSYGYYGNITWAGSRHRGDCTQVLCSGNHVNNLNGPDCDCAPGFMRTSVDPGAPLEISTQGTYNVHFYLSCHSAPCNISNTVYDGLECRCKDGYEGKIAWNGSNAQGTCEPAKCTVPNSNRAPGPKCRCNDGYYGKISWHESRHSGDCRQVFCLGQFVNQKHGPECDCMDGYRVQNPAKSRLIEHHALYSNFFLTCVAAPCNIENSTKADGHQCQCLHGYEGSITWKGSKPVGTCRPAECTVSFSNKQAGRACRCDDGYTGAIVWNGSVASGTCTPVPCRVHHSDYAPGIACKCLDGFFGQIRWSGPNSSGTCQPLPVCSGGIVHIAHLASQAHDPPGDGCEAHQPMVVRGAVCNDVDADSGRGFIKWFSAESMLPSCHRTFLELQSQCGVPSTAFSGILDLPTQCLKEPARPRCGSELAYPVAVRNASRYGCEDAHNEYQWIEFRGQRCGYDLIQWEAAIARSPGPGHKSQRCRTRSISAHCGATPMHEGLPAACVHLAEPAVFQDWQGRESTATPSLFKFFDDGTGQLVNASRLGLSFSTRCFRVACFNRGSRESSGLT